MRVKKSLIVEACGRRIDPKGLQSSYLDAGTVHLQEAIAGHDLGCGREQDWPNEAAKRQSFGIYPPVTKSSVPETLKKYPCFVEK